MEQKITSDQILSVLQQRALTDRLISEILRASTIEASAIIMQQQLEEIETGDDD